MLQHFARQFGTHPGVKGLRQLSTAVAQHHDVVIVGGGIVGSASAFWLKHKNPSLRVAVVEKDSTYQKCSTSLSVGGFRQQFCHPENIGLSMRSIKFLQEEMSELLRVGDDIPDVSFVEGGYLILASTEDGKQVLESNHKVQRSFNATVSLLEATELKERFPYMNVDDIKLGSFGYKNEGWLDPYALLSCFRRKNKEIGVEYFDDQVAGFQHTSDGNKIESVTLASGTHLSCGYAVNAAGAWAGDIAKAAGVVEPELAVRPKKRMVFQVHCPEFEQGVIAPLTVDPTGVYYRSDGANGHFLCGRSPNCDDDPDVNPEGDEMFVDHDFFMNEVWPVLAARVPMFENLKVKSSWSGLYEYNTLDQNAVIGPHSKIDNFIFANGFSGHGIQQAPAVGLLVAELICDGKISSVDVSAFGWNRMEEKRPYAETCIY